MKKHLIAAAVAAAVAVPAMAQNVSISGVFDVGAIGVVKQDVVAANAAAAVSNSTKNNATSTNGNWATSELILSGSEDLGGGLKASFRLGTGLNDGTATFANRDRFLGLEGDFGRVLLGRLSPASAVGYHGLTAATTNQGGTTYGLALASTDGTSALAAANFGAMVGGNFERSGSNTIQYTSPTINGFVVNASYSSNAADRSDADRQGETKAQQTGLHIGYSAGPLSVGIATNKRKVDREAVPAVAAVAAGAGVTQVLSVAAVTAQQEKADLDWIGGSYNFGVATVGLAHVRRDASTTSTAGVTTLTNDIKVNVLGVTAPFGALTFRASFYEGTNDQTALTTDDLDLSGYQLSLNYSLSKRTSLYAVVGQNKTERATVDTVSATRKFSSHAMGITHSF